MGKAGFYVFATVAAIALLCLALWGLWVLTLRSIALFRAWRLRVLDRRTPWTSYLTIGPEGWYQIGVRRASNGTVFEGPIQRFALPPDRDPLDVEVKLKEAGDQANLFNLRREREC